MLAVVVALGGVGRCRVGLLSGGAGCSLRPVLGVPNGRGFAAYRERGRGYARGYLEEGSGCSSIPM
jgi:hypothetical protein